MTVTQCTVPAHVAGFACDQLRVIQEVDSITDRVDTGTQGNRLLPRVPLIHMSRAVKDEEIEEGWKLFGMGRSTHSTPKHTSRGEKESNEWVEARPFGDSDDESEHVRDAKRNRPLDAIMEHMRLADGHVALTDELDLSSHAVSLLRVRRMQRDIAALRKEIAEVECALCHAASMRVTREGTRVCERCGFARSDVLSDEMGPHYEHPDARHSHPLAGDDVTRTFVDSAPCTDIDGAPRARGRRIDSVYARLSIDMDVRSQRLADVNDYIRALQPEMESIAGYTRAPPVTPSSTGRPCVPRQSAQRHSASRRASALQLLHEMHRVQKVDPGDLPVHTGRVPLSKRKRSLLSNAPCFSRTSEHGMALLGRIASHHPDSFRLAVLAAFGDVMDAYRHLGRIVRYNLLLPLIALWQGALVSGYLVEGVESFLRRWTPAMTEGVGGRSTRDRDTLNAREVLRRARKRFWARRMEFMAILERPNSRHPTGRWAVQWTHSPFDWIRARALWILRTSLEASAYEYALTSGHAQLLRDYTPALSNAVRQAVQYMEQHASEFTERRTRDVRLSSTGLARARESGGSVGRIANALTERAHLEMLRGVQDTRFERALSLACPDLQRMECQESLAAAVVLDVMDRINLHVPSLDPRLVDALRRHYRRRASIHGTEDTPSSLATRFGVPVMTLRRAALTVSLCEAARSNDTYRNRTRNYENV